LVRHRGCSLPLPSGLCQPGAAVLLHSLAMPSEAYRLPSAPPFIAPLYFVTWHCTALGHLVTWHCTALGHLWSRGTALR